VLLVFGLVFVLAAWLAGHTRPATALRRALAPTLRDHPAWVYATAFAVLLLVVVWGPAPAFRQLGYIIAFAVLLALGVHMLRRQAVSEFPDARAGETMSSIRGWYQGRHQPQGGVSELSAGGDASRITELERLAGLHDRGALTDAEFAAEKATLGIHA
jgi:Short C-terminal domain